MTNANPISLKPAPGRVPPFPIESEPDLDRVPMRGRLALTLRLVQAGESFVCAADQRSNVYRLAQSLGLVVTTARGPDGRLKVVRVL
jgi:hypothetical protein